MRPWLHSLRRQRGRKTRASALRRRGPAPQGVRRQLVEVAGRAWARLHYAQHVEPFWFDMVRVALPVCDLPPDLAPFRLVHLSDWHLHDEESVRRVQKSIELANSLEPDLVAITGDFIHDGHSKIETAGRLASSLHSRYGVVAVFGNHDWAVRSYWLRKYHVKQPRRQRLRESLGRVLEAYGVRLLRNEHVLITGESGRLAIVGLEDLWSHRCDVDLAMSGVPGEIPRIVLAHNPVTIERVGHYRCDLMLAGHTHGGQIKLLQNRLFALGRAVRAYRAGLFRINNAWLYVTTGVGCGSFRLRYGVKPEVALIELFSGDPERDECCVERIDSLSSRATA